MSLPSLPEPAYRPVSALAVAGFAVSTLTALVLGILGLLAFRSGTPLLMPWLSAVSGLGAVLSYVAWFRDRRCPEALSGQALAVWGIWLGIVPGLTYLAYYAATERAIRYQAQSFTDEWLGRLEKEELAAAFWQTLPPAQRQPIDPSQADLLKFRFGMTPSGPGAWLRFQQNNLVRLSILKLDERTITMDDAVTVRLCHGIEDASRWQAQGVRRWDYVGDDDGGGLRVELTYRLRRPEGEYDAVVPVWGRESRATPPAFPGRQWQIDVVHIQITPRWSPLGESLARLRRQAYDQVRHWQARVDQGELAEIPIRFAEDMLTQEPLDRDESPRQIVDLFQTSPKPVESLWLPEDEPILDWWLDRETPRLYFALPFEMRLASGAELFGSVIVALADPAVVETLRDHLADTHIRLPPSRADAWHIDRWYVRALRKTR
ncbi:MAG: hypothetical protein ACK4RK_17770 [Gemmataceae bacterium]